MIFFMFSSSRFFFFFKFQGFLALISLFADMWGDVLSVLSEVGNEPSMG